MGEFLTAEHIHKSYAGREILSDISLHLQEGELVSLLGVSGVGKTTLLNILSGLETPDTGSVFLWREEEKQEITGKAGCISYMLQKDLLLPHKTIIDNVSLPLRLAKKPKKIARECAAMFLPQFGLEGTERMYPAQLSGGMRQRAALLRTYLSSLYLGVNKLLLLDEPFSALDAITRSSMQEWYREVSEKLSLTTLLITHDIDEAILLSDRIYILGGEPGEIMGEISVMHTKPRKQEFTLDDSFLEYKRTIRTILQKSVAED